MIDILFDHGTFRCRHKLQSAQNALGFAKGFWLTYTSTYSQNTDINDVHGSTCEACTMGTATLCLQIPIVLKGMPAVLNNT